MSELTKDHCDHGGRKTIVRCTQELRRVGAGNLLCRQHLIRASEQTRERSLNHRRAFRARSDRGASHLYIPERLIRSLKQAIAWASGEGVPVRVTMVSVERVPVIDLRSVRQKLGLRQSR